MQYSFTLMMGEFQLNKIQHGIKKEIKNIKNKDKPSIPICIQIEVKLMFNPN